MGQPERKATATKFSAALREVGDVKAALTLAGVRADAVVKSFVGVFSDTFAMETGERGGQAHVVLKWVIAIGHGDLFP